MLYLLMIIAGLIIIAAGFRITHSAGKPWDILGALSLPAGMIITLLGVLLSSVPNFFKD